MQTLLQGNFSNLGLGLRKSVVFSAIVTATFAVLPFSAVHADTLFGVYAGAGTWDQDYSGDVP